jgi:hypothetical protein
MQPIKEFLQGKKTYLSAALIALVAICGWWLRVLDDTHTLLFLGAACAAAGLGAKSERTAAAILTVLGDIRQVQSKATVGQKIDPKQFAADLSKQIMSQFAGGGLVRSTPAGAMSNVVVPGNDPFPNKCIFCGQSINWNGGVCTEPKNDSAPGSDGQRRHVFMTVNGSPTK